MKVKHVYLFQNGMVAAFNEHDEQIPILQGVIFEVMNKIGQYADEDTKFLFSESINVSWYFKKKKETT